MRASPVCSPLAQLSSSASMLADPLSGAALYADVQRYDSFGPHRYGSPGAERALAWIAEELERAGLNVSSQRFSLARQYEFEAATLAVDGETRPVMPQWWIPERQATFSLTAPIAASDSGPAPDAFVRLTLPFDRGAYLTAQHVAALESAFARRPAAVLLTIDHPSGEIFTYNVDQKTQPWPVPVILVAPKDRSLLDLAQQSGRPVSVSVQGAWRRDVPGRNVVGRLDRGKGRWLAISTPVTSWFTSSCERGPGIAGFLAMARLAGDALARRRPGVRRDLGPRDRPWRHGAFPARRRAQARRHPGVGAFRRLAGLLRLAPRRRTLGHRSPGRHPPAPGAELAGDGGVGGAALQGHRGHAARPARAPASASCATCWRRAIHASSAWQVPIPSSTPPPIRRRRPARRSWNRSSGPLPRPWTTLPVRLCLIPLMFLSPC